MAINSFAHVSDREVIEATSRAATDERRATVDLLALLGEVDARRLYLSEGFSSLFTYCTGELKFSEHEAYHRIEAARAVREFPLILERLRDGSLTLTSITLLRPHLTPENADALIALALNKSRREVEHQMAALAPKSDVRALVRRLPDRKPATDIPAPCSGGRSDVGGTEARAQAPAEPRPTPRPLSTPLSGDRYLLRVTLSADAHAKLQRARDLMRHSLPHGDPAAIVERALTLLVDDLERRRMARVDRPREAKAVDASSRHVPAAVRRQVWTRDGGRCAFVGRQGRCAETSRLEFHHVQAFALGGATTTANLELRCRAHNQYEGALVFGDDLAFIGGTTTTRPGPS